MTLTSLEVSGLEVSESLVSGPLEDSASPGCFLKFPEEDILRVSRSAAGWADGLNRELNAVAGSGSSSSSGPFTVGVEFNPREPGRVS